MKQKILDRLNELIIQEKGRPITIDDTIKEADLDSLGIVFVSIELDSEYSLSDKTNNFWDMANLTVRQIVTGCVTPNV
jgi:acyl carrier protein